MDLPPSKIREYIDQFKDKNLREKVASILCDGEAFVNSFEDPKVMIVMEVISDRCFKELKQMINLIRSGKHNDEEELRRIRQHCIAINSITDIIMDWGSKLNSIDRHMNLM